MACQKCGRVGACLVCCCNSRDHGGLIPNLDTCRGCGHDVEQRWRRNRKPAPSRIPIAGRRR